MASPNTNQPSSSDSSATFMVQNNMEPWNNLLMQDCHNTQDTSVSTTDFSTTEPQNVAPACRSESQFFNFLLFKIPSLILVFLGNLLDELLW